MQNPGEEIVGEYLKVQFGCEFVEYNLQTPDIQGEIDVVGINIRDKKLYVCEVATHLITGLQYVNMASSQPDNINRFMKKFVKDINYAQKYFKGFEQVFMLWSPIVKNQSVKAKHNQARDTCEICKQIMDKTGVTLQLVINEKYQECLTELRKYAAKETKELKSPILRLMQVEEKLKMYLSKNQTSA
jgi:hypothetical protein